MEIAISIFVGFIVSFAINVYLRKEGSIHDIFVVVPVAALMWVLLNTLGGTL